MTPLGQRTAHMPQEMHRSPSMTARLSTTAMALAGQFFSQMRQAMQLTGHAFRASHPRPGWSSGR